MNESQQHHFPVTSTQVVHSLMRFAFVLRHRWKLVVGVLAAFFALSCFYYFAATRMYAARAELLVQQTGPVFMPTSGAESASQQTMLPTYERLFQNHVVLHRAAKRIQAMPRHLQVDVADSPFEKWPDRLKQSLSARSIRLTKAIEISYQSRSPRAAEAVVNAVVESYLEFMQLYHQNVAGEIADILQRESEQVSQRLSEKEHELLEAQRRLGDIGIREGSNLVHPLVQRAVKINEMLVQVQQDRMRLDATRAAIQSAIRKGEDLRQHLLNLEPFVGRELVFNALGMGERDRQLITRLEKDLVDKQQELAAMEPYFGKNHPQVLEAERSIQQLTAAVQSHQVTVGQRVQEMNSRRLGEMLLTMVNQELAKAVDHEQRLTQQYELARTEATRLNGQLEEIAIRKSEVERLRLLNNTLINRIENIDINQNQPDVRVEVVDPPKATENPISPRPLLIFGGALFAGLVVGGAGVLIADMLDDRFRSPEELKLQLGVPVLALVRHLPERLGAGLQKLQIFASPDSVESEAFRTLRTTVAFSGEELNCLSITSSEPGDGKTTILSNLGVSFAQVGKRTLLIDADLRRPGLSKLFDLKGHPGLSDILRASDAVDHVAPELVHHTDDANLDVIPSGPRPLDPTGLLGSQRFSELLAWAQMNYDQILVDCTPMLVASDAAIVGKFADGMMLVVQPQKNHRRLVLRTIEEAKSVGLKLMGVVVNRISNESGGDFYGSGYGYGHEYADKDAEDLVEQRSDLAA
ncbi:MAG: polysaccharide biosynthesis tyrosine autokinase [Pirellulaceae bacterium]